jgi:hypothetical protein
MGASNTFTPIGQNAEPVTVKASSDLDLDEITNFLECVRSRKLPNGDVLIGHRSAQAAHFVRRRRMLEVVVRRPAVQEVRTRAFA